MRDDEVPVGRLVSIIVSVLGATLLLSLGGLVALALSGADPAAGATLTHVIETVIGVFIGIAAGRLSSTN
ncbi:MAG: hypothetical protein ABI782_00355 [Anaerolineaceae bacterium]